MPEAFTKEKQEEIRGQLLQLLSVQGKFILALAAWANQKTGEMLSRKLAGRRQMSTHEFFEFFREFLYSEYDLMNGLTVDDFLWLKTHMAEADLFNPVDQLEVVKTWLSLISDARENIDYGTVVNLMKSIYAMWEHRDTLIKESLDNSIEMVVRLLEIYISGKGKIL